MKTLAQLRPISVVYDAHMGDDVFVVNKARVSFAKRTDRLRPVDERLIGFLARSGHWTPFAHPQVSVTVTAPVFVARQAFKSKVGFVENEVSRRYVKSAPVFWRPEVWRAGAPDVKQGSAGPMPREATALLDQAMNGAYWAAVEAYEALLAMGVAAELARIVLPQAMMTTWAWTGSLAAWARFHALRAAPDAQPETGEVAALAAAIIAPLFPVSWKALTGHAAKPQPLEDA